MARLSKDPRPVPVPAVVTLRSVAAAWGLPPWGLAGREPTDDERRRWLVRELVLRGMGI